MTRNGRNTRHRGGGDATPRSLLIPLLAAAATLLAASAARAGEIRLTLANDPISGNERKDDLYTSALDVDISVAGRHILFTERMFTNREDGLRFDETEASVALLPLAFGAWEARPELGVLHVGRGLLGEDVQNDVHRLTGSEPVFLEYVARSEIFPTAAITAARPLGRAAGLPLRLEVESRLAPGFRSTVEARVAARRNLPRGFAFEVTAGARADYVESRLLEAVVDELGPTASFAVGWHGITLSFEHNEYGTRSNHVAVGWRADF